MEDKDLDYKLEIEEALPDQPKNPKLLKILLGISLFIVLGLVAIIIYLGIDNNNLRDKNSTQGNTPPPPDNSTDIITDIISDISSDESTDSPGPGPQPFPPIEIDPFDYFGVKILNVSYIEDKVLENTFKTNGSNYIPELGPLNNDLDYEPNDRNNYDLYIPTFALERKEKINGIILWIHGGAWTGNDKTLMSQFCELYGQLGFISVTMGYTLLTEPYKNYSIYKNLDEITACIKSIKQELIKRDFNPEKLRLALAGYSSGAHLALLYSYLIKNEDTIPISFVINIVGPMGVAPEYYYILKNMSEPLDDITTKASIKIAIDEGKLIKLGTDDSHLKEMNMFLGNIYTEEEIESMKDGKGGINKDNDKYKDMYNKVRHAFIPLIDDKNKIPTLCIYGGADDMIGEAHYSYLKEKADQDGRTLDFLYMKYESHMFFVPFITRDPQSIRNMSSLIMKYLYNNFIKDE